MLAMYSVTTPSSSPPRVSCTTSATGPGRGGGTRTVTGAEGSSGAAGGTAVAGGGCGDGAVGGGVGVGADVGACACAMAGSTTGVDRLLRAAGTEGAWTTTVLTVGAGGAVWTTVFDPVSHPTAAPRQAKISPRVLRDGRLNEAFIVFRSVRDGYFAGKVDPRVANPPSRRFVLGSEGKPRNVTGPR
ncbi:MAG: hypothetical protein RJB04_583 [Verrucomicrobiota bacterium]